MTDESPGRATAAGDGADASPTRVTSASRDRVDLATLAATTIALVGASGPLVAGSTDPFAIAIVGLGASAVGAAIGVRWAALSRRVGGAVACLSGLLLALLSVYGLAHGRTAAVPIPPIEAVPSLVLAVFGAALTVAGGVAFVTGITDDGLRRRLSATVRYSLVAVAGYLAITVWVVLLATTVVPLLTGAPATELAVTERALLSQAGTVLGLGFAAWAFLVWTERDRSFVDLSIPTLRDLGYVVAGTVAIVGAALAIGALLGATGTESAAHSTFEGASEAPEVLLVLAVASIVVVGPFEELLYRNVVQKSLYGPFSRAGAVVVASVPFALVHVSAYAGGSVGQSLVSLGMVLVLSLLLGTIYERTENLLVPALVHGCYNAAVYLSAYASLVG
ncbi:CPBP family intramembrane glutamic endopeptidase [Halovivax limisalsi]|uniref:CPBP family intramembrane glutamic endopeptidase n=1 Tax=Halovivax limisalsi TaxID=1453760 RepID=UPI001FFC872E|nr:CPBP family intramembrane glutamic endopeptidase [Halovivax limisalsi]